jgi:hypothetical protein
MRMYLKYTSPEIFAQNLLIPAEGYLPVDPSNDIIKLQGIFCCTVASSGWLRLTGYWLQSPDHYKKPFAVTKCSPWLVSK